MELEVLHKGGGHTVNTHQICYARWPGVSGGGEKGLRFGEKEAEIEGIVMNGTCTGKDRGNKEVLWHGQKARRGVRVFDSKTKKRE